MFTFLRSLTKGAVRVAHTTPVLGTAYLRKKLTCRFCGSAMLLKRFVPLHPSGIRGYYLCAKGHDAAIDRNNVRHCTGHSGDRVWFAA